MGKLGTLLEGIRQARRHTQNSRPATKKGAIHEPTKPAHEYDTTATANRLAKLEGKRTNRKQKRKAGKARRAARRRAA